ncbi:MAG: sulfite exporter TauE/SafE family protein, partial [Mycobacterium sp.]
MRSLLIFILVGAGAQLVDGALGMAFGVTATTLLVLSGVGAAQASAAVHLAEVGTTFASGLSHWKFKNIDWGIVAKLGAPGAVGAFVGATVLSSLATEHAAPLMAAILVGIGGYVLLRFS